MKSFFKLCLAMLAIALSVLAIVALTSRPIRAAGPWYVAPGGDDGNDCLSSGAPCATINGAIGKASAGDTIYVATGTYTGTGDEVVLLDKDAMISGGWDETFVAQVASSTIDGEEARRGVVVNSGVSAVVERFTAQHGYTGDANGGGIYNSGTLTLTNCTINDNYAYYDGYDDHGGGGIYNIGALSLLSSTIKNNTATDSGGGIYGTNGSSTIIKDSRIFANEAFNNEGGGIHFDYDSHLSISRSWVVGNAALGNDVGGIGVSGGSAYIENSVIAGNTAQGTGGGLWFNGGGPYRVVNSHIVGNEATYEGSAITGNSVRVEVTNTLIISNTGKRESTIRGAVARSSC
jgi:predicted outer membrane repeat protein